MVIVLLDLWRIPFLKFEDKLCDMKNKTEFRYPTERYLNVVKQGYKDCGLDKSYLIKALNPI